jgi:hypothetical protein
MSSYQLDAQKSLRRTQLGGHEEHVLQLVLLHLAQPQQRKLAVLPLAHQCHGADGYGHLQTIRFGLELFLNESTNLWVLQMFL